MSIKVSTGLRNKLLDTSPLRTAMNLGFINIYAGVVPSDADAAIGSATLLCTISNAGTATGLTLEAAAVAGTITKETTEVWSGTNAAAGTASFYRHVAPGDDGTSSTTQARIQGTVGTSGADMNLSSVALANGAPQTLDYYSVTLPTL
jgi:hypothetical protein